jgi:hypothetical protein
MDDLPHWIWKLVKIKKAQSAEVTIHRPVYVQRRLKRMAGIYESGCAECLPIVKHGIATLRASTVAPYFASERSVGSVSTPGPLRFLMAVARCPSSPDKSSVLSTASVNSAANLECSLSPCGKVTTALLRFARSCRRASMNASLPWLGSPSPIIAEWTISAIPSEASTTANGEAGGTVYN